MVWHENFPTHKHAKLHHLVTLFHNTNVVSNQSREGSPDCARCVPPNIYEILPNYNVLQITPNYWQNVLIKRFTLTMDFTLTILLC